MSIIHRQLKNGKTVYDIRIQYGKVRINNTVSSTFTTAKRVEAKILQSLIEGKYGFFKNTKNPKFRESLKITRSP